MYKYLFGPVPSRRLGISLGVDLVPAKVCSLDCVYCEVGKTTKLTTHRKEYILYSRVTEELEHYFENNPDPDFITFSGSGEPTLNSRLGDVLTYIKEKRPNLPVAVLTNGTLLCDERVRSELAGADVVLPSLDAATEETFNRINRPDAAIEIEKYINGLVQFRKDYTGKIWLEVFILPGYNDHPEELLAMKKAIQRINPDSVQINTLDRPGTVESLVPATRAELERVKEFWDMPDVEIIAAAVTRKDMQSYRTDAEETILGTISRRPCTADDLAVILGIHRAEVNKYLDVLEGEGRIESVRQKRGVFYHPAGR
ncbi:MAG: radical SAM protein [Bacteroidales bacterium]|nr:radical SAM protein [Bacteroidales bacterium]